MCGRQPTRLHSCISARVSCTCANSQALQAPHPCATRTPTLTSGTHTLPRLSSVPFGSVFTERHKEEIRTNCITIEQIAMSSFEQRLYETRREVEKFCTTNDCRTPIGLICAESASDNVDARSDAAPASASDVDDCGARRAEIYHDCVDAHVLAICRASDDDFLFRISPPMKFLRGDGVIFFLYRSMYLQSLIFMKLLRSFVCLSHVPHIVKELIDAGALRTCRLSQITFTFPMRRWYSSRCFKHANRTRRSAIVPT